MSFLAPARAADPGRAGGLPAPRRVRLRLRGGRPDRRPDAGDLPPARGPGAPLHRREPAAVRCLRGRARRAPAGGSSPPPSDGDVDGLIELLAEDVDRPRRRRRQGPAVVRTDRRRRQGRAAVRGPRLASCGRLGATFEPHRVNGQPGVVFRGPHGGVFSVMSFEVVDGARRDDPLDRQPGQARPPGPRGDPARCPRRGPGLTPTRATMPRVTAADRRAP